LIDHPQIGQVMLQGLLQLKMHPALPDQILKAAAEQAPRLGDQPPFPLPQPISALVPYVEMHPHPDTPLTPLLQTLVATVKIRMTQTDDPKAPFRDIQDVFSPFSSHLPTFQSVSFIQEHIRELFSIPTERLKELPAEDQAVIRSIITDYLQSKNMLKK
jgi:hypothetical protein